MSLRDEKTLTMYTNPSKKQKPLSQFLIEETVAASYGNGIVESETIGLVTAILGGNIPDETIHYLMGMSLRQLSQTTVEELNAIPGIGKQKAVRLKAVFELTRRLATMLPEEKPTIASSDDAADLVAAEMRYLDREHFRVLLLNTINQVIGIDNVSVGTLKSSFANPSEVFRNAIKRSAASIILVHNHPSGNPTPSEQDISITRILCEAGKIIGIEVLDHIIIGNGCHVSLNAKGLMRKC